MRPACLAVAAICLSSTAAIAAPALQISVPAGRLGDAIRAIGTQAGVTIGVSDPALAAIMVPGIHRRTSVSNALTRLLAGTAAGFVQSDPQTFRIIRRSPAALRTPSVTGLRAPLLPAAAIEGATIIVTGSKRSESLADYAGSVALVDVSSLRPGRLAHGSDALVETQPALSATHLGPGRNKLFVRGIADSSFNGPTESTVGQYLGEIRLNYNAPDPDLSLYDMQSVEILEGPQGTLYGAGSLGGIIRLVPTPPDLGHASAILSAGASLTAHGGPGTDGALIVNLPVIDGVAALRGVIYGSIDGGYIDDPPHDRFDINRTNTRGGRVTLRLRPASDWTVDLGGVVQDINSRDGQYSERGQQPLARSSVIAQPFDNDYTLGSLVVRHAIGATDFVSATSAVFHDLGSVFDASKGDAAPIRYAEDDRINILTNETRLSRHTAGGGGWVIGVELLRSTNRLTRTLGPPGAESRIAGTRNRIEEASIYGEATLRLTGQLFATGGGRIAYDHTVGEEIDAEGGDEPRRHDVSLLPSVGLLWTLAPRLSLYSRYQEGYRPGGLSVQASATQRFEADSVATIEVGARFGHPGDRFYASGAISYAHWEDIQADLVGTDGLPYTANIGSGRIVGVELQAAWRPLRDLTLEGAMFVNDSNLSKPAPAFAGEKDATLPNIADAVARVSARYTVTLLGRVVEMTASANYVGRSRLGVGPVFDLSQGRYVNSAAGISVPLGRATISLDANNLADHRGNIFSLGNPFGVSAGQQTTPLRPRTVRLGATMRF